MEQRPGLRVTDTWGAATNDDVTIELFEALYEELGGPERDNDLITLSDDDGWKLEFSRGSVRYQNSEAAGEVGALNLADRDEALAVADDFIRGDLEALLGRSWEKN